MDRHISIETAILLLDKRLAIPLSRTATNHRAAAYILIHATFAETKVGLKINTGKLVSWIKRRKAVVRKRTGQIGRDIDEWSRRKVSLTTPFLDVQPRHVSLSLSLAIMLHNLPVARWRWLRWSGRPPPPLPLNRPGLVVIGERGCWRTLWSLRSPRTGAACVCIAVKSGPPEKATSFNPHRTP